MVEQKSRRTISWMCPFLMLSLRRLLVWPVYRVMKANAPRSYDPQHVPPELLP